MARLRNSIPATLLVAVISLLLVPAAASAASELEANPSTLSFPDTGIHDPAQSQNTQITNTGDETASLSGFNAATPFSINYGASNCDEIGTLEVGGTCNLAVDFDPQTTGA